MRTLTCVSLLLCLSGQAAAASDEDRFRESGASYVIAVHQRLHARWKTFTDMLRTLPAGSRLREDGKLTATVEIAVWPDGTVVHVERTRGSGVPGFDEAPGELLCDVGTLPVPPPELRSDDGRIHLRWSFERAAGDADHGVVIERRLPVQEAVETLVGTNNEQLAARRVGEEIAAHPEQRANLLRQLADAVARHDASSEDPLRRATAARALGLSSQGAPLLLALARDREGAVRAEALESIGHASPSRERIALALAALDGPDAGAAARGIEQWGRRLVLAATDRAQLGAQVRRTLAAGRAPVECAEALRALGDSAGAAAQTVELLSATPTRMAGAQAALQLADAALTAPILAAMQDATVPEQAVLLDALGRLGAKLPAAGRAAILRAMSDSHAPVRAEAMRAAGMAGERRARGRLIDALADSDAGVRAASVAALLPLAGEGAVDELFRPLRDPAAPVRAALAAALVSHPSAAGQPLLRRLRKDADPAVRAACAGSSPPATAASGDSALLRASNDVDRGRAAADWLEAHAVVAPPAALVPPAPSVQLTTLAR